MSNDSIFFDIIKITKNVIGGYQNEKRHLRIRGKSPRSLIPFLNKIISSISLPVRMDMI